LIRKEHVDVAMEFSRCARAGRQPPTGQRPTRGRPISPDEASSRCPKRQSPSKLNSVRPALERTDT